MPEHLKALAVILTLASIVFALVRQPACAQAIAREDFNRRRNLWLAITLLAFVAQDFWLFILIAGVLLARASRRDDNPVALFFFMLFAIPKISAQIPGLGEINYLVDIDYLRLLSLVILLPVFLKLRRHAVAKKDPVSLPDILLGLHVFLIVADQVIAGAATAAARALFKELTEVVLPYYVASRALKDMRKLYDATMSFVVAAATLALLGLVEFVKHWLLYSSLDNVLGVPWLFGRYLMRGEHLRAMATTGQPIVLGYVMTVALGYLLVLRNQVPQRAGWFALLALLLAGEIAALSRGPWVGAAAVAITLMATGPRFLPRLFKLSVLVAFAAPVLLSTKAGATVIDYLPFIGKVDEGSVTYRAHLLELSWGIIAQNPLFGSADYLDHLEEMRQGEGIIDIVNSYLLITLNHGLVGLGIFVGFFGVIGLGLIRAIRLLDPQDERHHLARGLLAVLLGILVTISTVSPITVVPIVYWAFAGLAVGYLRLITPRERR